MRNLKKILALVLALVMSLSLMATAGAASFQDVTDDNPYKTAIDVLDQLKVFQGFEDGSFKPTDSLNRAQAAVLVYRIATGDVDNKYLDNYTYMAQSKFNDLDGYNWAKGYINYCQNAGIVVGTSATTFNPGAPVTGYQLLVMVLRTLGYGKGGEFSDPKGWELQTASIAAREGITKNVTGGDFGAPAPRQMVAEILFRGLLHDTVAYSPLTPDGYTKSGETLGKKNLGLEDISGVVMANEWADLEDSDPLAEGKTRLLVGEKVYNLDVSSALTDVGELRHAYVQNGAKVLTSLEDAGGNTVKDSKDLERRGEGIKVDKLRGEVKLDKDTEYFIDFEEATQYTTPYRIRYVLDYTTGNLNNTTTNAETVRKAIIDAADEDTVVSPSTAITSGNGTISVTIKPKCKVSSEDRKWMEYIFADGDLDHNVADPSKPDEYKVGEIYVNTQSTKDISDDPNYYYEKFEDEFLTYEDNVKNITESGNGNWLKIVDNDGDGVAEYVFLTEFVMTTITDWNKKTEKWDFEYEDGVKNSDIKLVEGTSELALNDVILYTKIDGVYHVSKPEPVEMTVAKKGIDYKNKTLTGTDETVYDWSEIAHKADNLYDDVSYAVQGVTYDLYQDHFGFTRLYKESDGGFVLLTDGYYATDRRDAEYKAQIWNGEFTDVDVLDTADVEEIISNMVNTEDDFKQTIGNRTKDDEGTWKRLYRFNSTYYDGTGHQEHSGDPYIQAATDIPTGNDHYKYNTNIASYVVNADGAYALSLARDHRENARTHYNSFAIDVTNYTVKAKDQVLWGIETLDVNGDIDDVQRINTTTETVYYLVEGTGKNMKVTTWTGYNNAPSNYTVERAYAVTSYVADINDWDNKLPYEVAEVVVIESTKASVPNAYMAINLEQRMFGKNQIGLNALGYHPDAEKWGLDTVTMKPSNKVSTLALQGSADWPDANNDMMNFYYVNDDGEAVRIESNYNHFGIYAGRVVTSPQVEHRNYIQITKDGSTAATQANSFFFPEDLDESYVVTYDRTTSSVRTKYDVGYTDDYDITNPDDAVDTYVQDGDGDRVIYMVDGDGNVGFVVNVTDSIYTKANGDKEVVPGLSELWDQISGNAKKDTRIPIDITLNAENGETIEIEGVNAADNVEQTATGILVNKTNLLQIKIRVTGGTLGVIRFNDGWNEIVDQRSEADENGWVTCTIYKLQTQSRVVPAAEENVIATVKYVIELIKEAKKTIGTGEDEITLEDAQAVLKELEMYNVPGVIVEENAEAIKDGDTTVSDAVDTVGDKIDTAETENNEAVQDSLQNLTDALEAWKVVIAGGTLSDDYKAKETIAEEYAEKIKAAADAEKIAELEREALIAMSDEIATTDAELEAELGKIAPLFCSGLTYKIDRGANKIYVTGGTVNPVVDKNTDDVELLEAMMRWYWDQSAEGEGTFEVQKDGEGAVTGYKLTYTDENGDTVNVTKTATEIINAVVTEDTGYAFLTIDCRSIVDMENDQAWLLSRTLTKSEYDTAIAGTGVITCTPRVWQDQEFDVTSVDIDIKDLTWPTAG